MARIFLLCILTISTIYCGYIVFEQAELYCIELENRLKYIKGEPKL